MTQKLISASAVRDALGGVSDMTLWRWLDDPAMMFPRPVYIGRRRFWRETDIEQWVDSRSSFASVAAE